MRTDRELLELAAKAGGLRIKYWAADDYPVVLDKDQRQYGWNPLMYDSDALRLVVDLQMLVGPNPASRDATVFAWAREKRAIAQYQAIGEDPYAATRRAIVRAAAAMADQGVLGAA